MSKFWSWFIPFILIICILIFMLITKVNNNNTISNDFKLEFYDKADNVIELGNINDKKVYSTYRINKIDGKDISKYLSEELMDKIFNKMEYMDSLNDGGTAIFHSSNLANEEFYIVRCRTLMGNNDIYISDKALIGYCRS